MGEKLVRWLMQAMFAVEDLATTATVKQDAWTWNVLDKDITRVRQLNDTE